MKKKLIITESQYAELKKRLVETPFDKLTKTVIKVGDIIEVETNKRVFLYKVISSFGGQIQMDGIDTDIKDYRFFISSNGLNKNNFYGKKINKVKNPDLLKNPQSWEKFNAVITNFKVNRNNKIIDSADIGTGQTTTTSTNNQTKTPGTKPEADEVKPEVPDGYTEEEIKKAGKEILSHYDSKTGKTDDPVLQRLLIRNPDFMERVSAEMKGQRVNFSGILAAQKLASEYVDKKLGNGFIPFKKAKYQVLDSVFIDYKKDATSEVQFNRELNREYYAVNQRQSIGVTYKTLINKEENYQIKVIEKADGEDDVFICQFYKFADLKLNTETDLYSKEVKIKFLKSEGYVPETKQ